MLDGLIINDVNNGKASDMSHQGPLLGSSDNDAVEADFGKRLASRMPWQRVAVALVMSEMPQESPRKHAV